MMAHNFKIFIEPNWKTNDVGNELENADKKEMERIEILIVH